MVFRIKQFFRLLFDYWIVRRKLKKGHEYCSMFKVSEDMVINDRISTEMIINSEAQRVMIRYKLELNFKYKVGTTHDDFIKGYQTILIRFTLKDNGTL